ncbi:putative transcriptional regulator, TetR family protein [Sphaerisporangium rufum]|uniref:Transcriptional regulator, TetR family protein n=1 Tax=Sphaerisporangium rufum TaxID=1381558 RepID=A0A919R0A6_9ACTN|nr:TetR family transcriptional regulator [Sphaerisporangium rufum]GII77406.1 putative transcriptional regulator, TetR family protein [Sphaerisporangium rufum]
MAADKLTRETVIDAALALADQEGAGAVTIRRLAGRLGVTPMALYWHFTNKDELVAAMADHLLDRVTADLTPGDGWRRRLRVMVEALVGAMREHPCLPDLLAAVPEKRELESFRRATEVVLEVLTSAGFTLRESDYISMYLLHGAIGLVNNRPGRQATTPEEAEEYRRLLRLRMESLPPDRYPCMISYARTLCEPPDMAEYFDVGVNLLLGGVDALAERNVAGRAGQAGGDAAAAPR